MGKKVFANGMEISGKASDHKVIAAMPDVCLSPPPPPTGPVAIPYPDTSKSADLQDGTKSVKIGGEPVCRGSQSYYKTSPLGDEASTKSFGANVIDHSNAGKTYCQAFSMDVKVEQEAVTRTGDLTTSNHAGEQPAGGGPMAQIGGVGTGESSDDKPECPCCHGELHENQKNDDGSPAPKVKRDDYYQGKKNAVDAKIAGYPAWAKANPQKAAANLTLKFGAPIFPHFTGPSAAAAAEEQRRAAVIHEELSQAMAANPDCPNVHDPKDEGCGTHFATPAAKRTKLVDGKAKAQTPAQWAREEFTSGVRNAAIARARADYPGRTIPDDDKVNHITPLDAGGCPKNPKNLIPDGALDPKCKRIDDLQTVLQGRQG